ncbi:uncharacterized protein PG986_014334 [Apiospora aurea]|uniref:Uncharacterized protein n=1 Tax=Apiospora aurea TaxID=335848 RepID=A0ABR1PSQ7_9PEZI
MDYSNTTSRINSSPNLLRDGPTLYSGSCGVTDPIIRELEQQIILNDMILSANGGIPYMPQDPALQSNPSAVYAPPLVCEKQAVPPIVPTATAVGTPMAGYEPYGVTINPPPPLPETRHNPTDPPFNPQPAGGVLEVMGSSQAAATSQPSPASAFSSSTAHASEWGAPRQNVHHHPENWRSAILTAQQKKKQYHKYQKQLHERGLVEIKAAATAAAAEAAAIATTKATATSPPEEGQIVDRTMAKDMSTARKELAQMGMYLQKVAQQQRMMVDDTLHGWVGES